MTTSRRAALSALAGAFSAAWAHAQNPDTPHPKIAPERVHRFESEDLRVPDFPAEGHILDIGGGGEGVIGLMKGAQVVAIDLSRRELAGAPAGPLKIVMDARDLKFLDGSFRTATSFFTLMYVPEDGQEQVFREVHRVLAPGGRFLIWDVELPTRPDPAKDVAVYRFRFDLPSRRVETGYGTFFPARPHDVAYFVALARKTGFQVGQQERHGRTVRLTLTR